jgi:ketosteroid isomerase-like protein
MLMNLRDPVKLFPLVETIPLPVRTGHSGNAIYKRLPMLQMIRHLRISTLRIVDLGGPTMLAFFPSALILFASTSTSSVLAPAGKERDRVSAVVQIRSVLRAQQDAWNRGDIDGFMNGYARSKSTVFISEDTLRRGWETVRDRYREKYSDRAKMGTLTFSDLEITPLSPDSAMVLGCWRLERANDRPHGRFTLIFRRLPEGWRIVHDHTSAAVPAR